MTLANSIAASYGSIPKKSDDQSSTVSISTADNAELEQTPNPEATSETLLLESGSNNNKDGDDIHDDTDVEYLTGRLNLMENSIAKNQVKSNRLLHILCFMVIVLMACFAMEIIHEYSSDSHMNSLDSEVQEVEKFEEDLSSQVNNEIEEVQGEVDSMKPLVNDVQEKLTELEQSKIANEVQVIMKELNDKLHYKNYYSTFELIVNSWMDSSFKGGQVDLQPLVFYLSGYDSRRIDDIQNAGLAFSKILQKLGLETNNKFVHEWTSYKTNVEIGLKEAKNGVLYITDLLYEYRHDAAFVEKVLNDAKATTTLFIESEHASNLADVQNANPNLQMMISSFRAFFL